MNSQVAFLLLCFVGGTEVGSQWLGFEPYEDRPEKNSKVRFCDKESFQNCSNEFVFSFFTIASTYNRDSFWGMFYFSVKSYLYWA